MLRVRLMQMDAGVPPVQVLAESGTAKVPSRFLRPAHDLPSTASPELDLEEIPVVDASQLDEEHQLQILDKACREWGFFQLTGHGIPHSLLETTRDVIRGFFSLPQAEKESYTAVNSKTGKEGYGRYFVPSEETPLDWGDVFYHAIPPIALQWPVNPPHYKETMQAYGTQLQMLAQNILAAMSKALNQQPEFLNNVFGGSKAVGTVRMNYYPPCPEPNRVLGLSPHSDGVGITLLLQDEVEGLQIRKKGQWKSVKSIPDAFVVNVGDMVEIITNGTYKSVEHRAIVNSERARISAAYFYHPGFEETLKPMISDEQSVFKEMSVQEFLTCMFSKELRGKGHLDFARL